ncbi:hypothetical protein [Paraburkholderia sp. C35]|uniref:hypothetical protein n=1 Tax=Paraburkholderia sp. C35 TaxID=2126993 RepID=UPI000D69A4F5|nr:hypothetical protein [Paraburkholderia sp. C35]
MEATKIMPVEQCGAVGKCQSSPAGYSHMLQSRYSYSEPSPNVVAKYAMQQLEQARQKDVEMHEKNVPAIETNKAITERVKAFMAEIGMPNSHSERDTKSRARYPKSLTIQSGWIGDVARHIKTSDGFEYATSTYERLKRDYESYAERAEQEAEQKRTELERKAEAEKQARRANVELARIVLRYELPEDSDWRDVLDALCEKDQRIDLALAMMDVRADWNEGAYPVRNAIDRFTIETDEDKAIANDILACLHDFEDGRVFRDATWNYDHLIASVTDQQLAQDARAAYEQVHKDR